MISTVSIRLDSGIFVAVHAELFGDYAIHQQMDAGGQRPLHGWAITHRASGLLVWKVHKRAEATRVAQWLAEHSPLAPDANAALLLRDTPGTVLAQLGEQLAVIATRWCARTDAPLADD